MKKKLKCILLIDDNESDNFLHKRVIEKSEIAERVVVVLNGKEALDFISAIGRCENTDGLCSQPELIFLDINMPVMDGWEFLEEYQKLEDIKKGKTVITMLTTSINPADQIKAEKMMDASCFQYKPLTLATIRLIMQKHFPKNF
jgi:CheY-like chemotaxis protein